MNKLFITFILLIRSTIYAQKKYQKEYYTSGQIKKKAEF